MPQVFFHFLVDIQDPTLYSSTTVTFRSYFIAPTTASSKSRKYASDGLLVLIFATILCFFFFFFVNTLITAQGRHYNSSSAWLVVCLRLSKHYLVVRASLTQSLSPYCFEPNGCYAVHLQDAVCHVARIHRVLSLKRGNLMLVGVGGSGRQSLTRLAAYICGQELFTIEIAKNYRQVSDRDRICLRLQQ